MEHEIVTYLVQGTDGAIYGPVDVPTLQAWAREGRITPETWLAVSATNPPFHAGEMPDLQTFWPVTPDVRPVPATACPHCGQPVAAGAPFCPFCGYGRRPLTPEGPPSQQLTGLRGIDFLLGLLPTALLLIGPTAWTLIVPGSLPLWETLLWLVIGAVPAIVALVLLRSYQAIKRGVGTGLALSCMLVPLLVTVGVVSAVHTFFSTPFKPCNYP